MNSELARNILSQPDSLAGVLHHQVGSGAAALSQAAALLRSGRRVLITGMGASLYASLPFEYALSSIGIDAVSIEAGELLHFRQAAFHDAITVVVSRSGESVEIARLLETFKGRNPIIGISNVPGSLLARSADVSIHINSLADEYVAVQTYTGTLLTMHLLACVCSPALLPGVDSIAPLLPAFSHLVESSMQALTESDDFLAAGSPFYLLARGPSIASAHAGALLFHEVAKCAAVAMPIASFRHGPVEVVDDRFRAFIFAPQAKTRELNLALARDLARFGAHIQLLGPGPAESSPGIRFCELPEVPEMLAPLFEIVPLQAAALRAAQLRGIPPGTFRYAPQVAVDEATFGRRQES
jgi:glucosamine--fructose-6-phosphate aminotransferase (isomerizing)